ncbi:hypothetical protein [Gilvimarinus sp. DA14]|uniref:hypothetical protein n=1 Tax=Gilvimarinus sp. DA14 TaxID=2956798 RepID=UPI0020B8AFE3|nr:hypothetical protein [Gilvimarinus sp. DA14]UTF59567.1 hypothetical protein NHM04_13950 [Gilvimarinus sp. DA14]
MAKNRAAFASEGVVYPRFTGFHGGTQWGVVAAVQPRPWESEIGARLDIRDKAGAQAYRQQLVTSIDEELLACRNRHTLVFSSEHFHSRLSTPALLAELKELLSRWSDNVEVVVYFRRQDRVAVSLYSTKLKTGQLNPPVFPPFKAGSLPYYFDYARIYANWSQTFGEDAVKAGIFEPQRLDDGDLLTDFCHLADISMSGKKRPAKVNESLSETGVQLLSELNRQWPKGPGQGLNLSRELLVLSISRKHKGRSFPATRAQAEAFYGHFAAGNAQVAKQAFPAHEGPLFDENFNDYPEVLVPPGADFSDEVSDRIKAWRAAAAAEQKVGVGRWLLPARRLLGGAVVGVISCVARVRRWRAKPQAGSAVDLPPVFLHMGLPKTATTTLQETLFSQHPGICYLGKSNSWRTGKHCASEDIYRALQPILWQCWKPTDVAQVRSVLRSYSQMRGPEKPILGSWEGLLIKPAVEFQAILRGAKDALGDIRLVVTMRNPLKRLPSAYLHALKTCALNGKHHTIPNGRAFITFAEWLEWGGRLRLINDTRFDFEKNLRFAVKFLGADKVGVFLMEDMIENREAFFGRVMDFVGVERLGAELVDDKHLSPALTAAEFDFLKSLDASPEQRNKWFALGNRDRRLRLASIAEKANGDKYTAVLSDAERTLIANRSRSLHHWLLNTFDLELERHGYPL